ncbi:MAG: B12-binding domain-containing radical SAM protein [Alphaproteobacteria bacterium]|nr:B12-binding domain-containing radical SAM protein [Alphaproteobacteria bacterium]
MADKPVKSKKDFKVLIVYPNLPLMLVPGIAIALFTRIFKDQGYQVDLFDTTHYDTDETNYSETRINYSEHRVDLLNVRRFDVKKDLGISLGSNMLADFRGKVGEYNPDFMIFSVVEDTFLQTLSMLRTVEDLDIPHLVGGVFPTMAPGRCIEAPEIHLIGPGEGEHTVVAVAEAVRNGEPLDGIAGTWYKGASGEVCKYPQRPLVNISEVVPDFSLFDETRFMRPMGGRIFKMIPVESYRGCPYACTYCNSPAQRAFSSENELGNFMRRKTMDVLRAEMRSYVETYAPDFFFFVDDSFLARPRREVFEFCDMYEEFKLPFYFNTRAENCDPEILSRLKEVNCYRIAFGIEAGNEQYRTKILRRKITNDEIIKRFKWIADSGIAFSLNLIIGMPGETRELVMDTVELVRAIQGYDSVTGFIFTPYHGTTLRQVAITNGWLDPRTITRHNTSRSLLRMPPPCLNADEIDGLLSILPLYCYFPKAEWPSLRRAEENTAEGLNIRKFFSDIYAKNFLSDTQDSEKTYITGEAAHWGKEPEEYFQGTPNRMDEEMLSRLVGMGSPLA